MGTVKMYKVEAIQDRPVPDLALLKYAQTISGKLKNNVNFPNLGTTATDIDAAAVAFGNAIDNMANQKGAGEARTAARTVLIQKIDHAVDFVNGVAENAPPAQVAAIIASAGFRTKKVPVRTKAQLAVKYGNATGVVLLVALAAGKSAMYYFQYSTDGTHWVSCPNIMKSQTLVTGLTVGTTYSFRFQAQTRKGLTEWSGVVTFVVR
jgi:hypothetical protein